MHIRGHSHRTAGLIVDRAVRHLTQSQYYNKCKPQGGAGGLDKQLPTCYDRIFVKFTKHFTPDRFLLWDGAELYCAVCRK